MIVYFDSWSFSLFPAFPVSLLESLSLCLYSSVSMFVSLSVSVRFMCLCHSQYTLNSCFILKVPHLMCVCFLSHQLVSVNLCSPGVPTPTDDFFVKMETLAPRLTKNREVWLWLCGAQRTWVHNRKQQKKKKNPQNPVSQTQNHHKGTCHNWG